MLCAVSILMLVIKVVDSENCEEWQLDDFRSPKLDARAFAVLLTQLDSALLCECSKNDELMRSQYCLSRIVVKTSESENY